MCARLGLVAFVRWGVVVLLAWGCGAPVTYPRSAEIYEGPRYAVHTNVSHGNATASFERDATDGSMAVETTEYEGHASSPLWGENSGLRLTEVLFNLDGEVGFAPTEWLYFGMSLSLQASGAELRMQALSERDGKPLSATFALGALTPSFVGDDGVGARFGLDLSRTFDGFELVLGGYGSWEPRERNMHADNFVFPSNETPRWHIGRTGLTVLRNEWKVSIPFGVAMRLGDSKLIFGVVPEVTLDAHLVESVCTGPCGVGTLSDYEQDFALYITLSGVVEPSSDDDGAAR